MLCFGSNNRLWVCFLGVSVAFCTIGVQAEWVEIQKADGQISHFDVEIADTKEKAIKGLMFRTELPENAGMIFIQPHDQIWAMWMKNTYIPLDMVFFTRSGGVVKVIENAVPHDLTPLSSGVAVAGVLELVGGAAEKFNIQQNDKIIGDFLNK